MRHHTLIKQVSFKGRGWKKNKKIKLSYGSIGLVTLKNLQFEYSYFNLIKKFLKFFYKLKYALTNKLKVWVFLNGNFPVSRKSKNSRMGKGKGSLIRWLIKLPQGHTILEFYGVDYLRLKKLTTYWNKLLNFKILIIKL